MAKKFQLIETEIRLKISEQVKVNGITSDLVVIGVLNLVKGTFYTQGKLNSRHVDRSNDEVTAGIIETHRMMQAAMNEELMARAREVLMEIQANSGGTKNQLSMGFESKEQDEEEEGEGGTDEEGLDSTSRSLVGSGVAIQDTRPKRQYIKKN